MEKVAILYFFIAQKVFIQTFIQKYTFLESIYSEDCKSAQFEWILGVGKILYLKQKQNSTYTYKLSKAAFFLPIRLNVINKLSIWKVEQKPIQE